MAPPAEVARERASRDPARSSEVSLKLSVVIPTWRRTDDLARCLAAVIRQVHPPDQIVIVVRTDDHATLELLAQTKARIPALRPIEVAAPGVVAALNDGLDAAEGDLIAIVDDDTVPRPDWLARVCAAFEADPSVGGVGGRDAIAEEPPSEEDVPVGKVHWYGRVVGNHHLGVGGPREVDVLKGANMAFRTTALRGIGLDERLRGGGAQPHWEIALSLAVKRSGWKLIYDPAICVDHYPAPRLAGERGAASPEALSAAVHNETYALVRWLPPARKLAPVVYGLLIGTRHAPGLVLLGERMVRGADRGIALRSFRVALGARLQALLTWVRRSP